MLQLLTALALALALMVGVAAPASAQQAFPLALRDHQFVPAELVLPANVKVELSIRNDQTVPAEFESNSLHREKVVPPGGTVSVFVGPLDPGRYEFFDDFHPETRGSIVVR